MHSAKLLGSVHGVVVNAKKDAVGSFTRGKATTTKKEGERKVSGLAVEKGVQRTRWIGDVLKVQPSLEVGDRCGTSS